MLNRISISQFLEGLISALLLENVKQLSFDDVETNRRMSSLIDSLSDAAKHAYQLGDQQLAYDLFMVLDRISPNPNTGAFDGFWSALRELQPAHAAIHNPLYVALDLKGTNTMASQTIESLPPPWKQIIQKSARSMAHA